jgi:hypothetical protein
MISNQQKIHRKKGLTMIRNLILSALAALILTGCIGTTHNFMIRFNDIEGLRKNDQVFILQNFYKTDKIPNIYLEDDL